MKALIVIATDDRDVLGYFLQRQEGAIPGDHRARSLKTFSLLKVVVYSSRTDVSLSTFLLDKAKDYDAIACLLDSGNSNWIEDEHFGLFVAEFTSQHAKGKMQNYFFRSFSEWLPNFTFIASRVARRNEFVRLLLPYKVFKFPGLPELGRKLRSVANSGSFKRELDLFLAAVNARRTPKTKGGRFDQVYFVDDSGFFFRLGPEKHAEAEDGSAHNISCRIEKVLRFGFKIDDRRHFNVSCDGGARISASFLNCHDAEESSYGPSTHLNVFPNNFIET